MDFYRSQYLISGSGPWPSSGGTVPDEHVFTVAPSDLTFLLHECVRCFWMKVAGGQRRPQSPMPGVFTRLDRIQRSFFNGRRTSEVHESLPPGRLDCTDLKVCSAPLAFEGSRARLRIRGAIDALVEFDDGAFGIIDFKTSSPSESSKTNYNLQLQAYATALEQNDWLYRGCSQITHLGLLCFDPGELERAAGGLVYAVDVTWIPMERDQDGFIAFLDQVMLILQEPNPPPAGPDCRWCRWTEDHKAG